MEKTTGIDEIPFSKLQIGQDDQMKEPVEVMESLVPLPPTTETLEDMTKNTDGERVTEVERTMEVTESLVLPPPIREA